MGFRRASSPAPAATVKRLLILTVPAIEQRPVTVTDPYVPGGIDCPTPKQMKLDLDEALAAVHRPITRPANASFEPNGCRRYSSRLRRAAHVYVMKA